MIGITELQTIKNWISANRIWLIIALISFSALILTSIYYLTVGDQPTVTGLRVKSDSSDIYPIKPIEQTSLQLTSLTTDNQPPVTTLKVNDQSVNLPSSGTVHKVIDNGSGKTTIDVSSDSKSSGAGSSNSYMNIELNSVSQSSSNAEAGQ